MKERGVGEGGKPNNANFTIPVQVPLNYKYYKNVTFNDSNKTCLQSMNSKLPQEHTSRKKQIAVRNNSK